MAKGSSDTQIKHTDGRSGLKLILDDDTWLLMRPSGTQSVLRVHTEAPTPGSQQLADEARAWIAR
jgi:phosphomannomutase